MPRRVFFSFHYTHDNWRAAKVRNIGVIEGNRPATDNDWEAVKRGGDNSIRTWISQQMHERSCTIVLVGTRTAGRRWINHEIIESWNRVMGVAGIHIHGLLGPKGENSAMGRNPFDDISYNGRPLSSVVHCYNPAGNNSRQKYRWIEENLANIVEEAISIRKRKGLIYLTTQNRLR